MLRDNPREQTSKKCAESLRRRRQRDKQLRSEVFGADCVANGAFGLFYLGMVFEKSGQLETAAMCFRNSFRIDNRVLCAYFKFTEVIARVELSESLGKRPGAQPAKGKRVGGQVKFKHKTVLTNKLMAYLLQDDSDKKVLRKRKALKDEAALDEPRKRQRRQAGGGQGRGLRDNSPEDFLVLQHNLETLADSGDPLPADPKKENKSAFKRVKLGESERSAKAEGRLGVKANCLVFAGEEVVSVAKGCLFGQSNCQEARRFGPGDSPFKPTDKLASGLQKENQEGASEADMQSAVAAREKSARARSRKSASLVGAFEAALRNAESHRIEDLIALIKPGVVCQQFNEFPRAKEAFSQLVVEGKGLGALNCSYLTVQIAKCWVSMMNYEEAAKNFEAAFSSNPNALEGLDVYSSCLWYLKDTIKMIELNQRVARLFRNSPVALTVQGNCCSMIKKTEEAIALFKSASKTDPLNSYVCCLLGHEFVFLEDFKSARLFYQKALEIDPHQFNAYWGLGNIHLQINDYHNALVFFSNALAFNRFSPLIYSYIGIASLNLNLNKKALESFEKAEEFQAESVMNSYYKAVAYFKLGEYALGSRLLEQLAVSVKNEPKIFVLLGKIYHAMGRFEDVNDCFNKAIQLDPRDSQGKIRELLELLNLQAGSEGLSNLAEEAERSVGCNSPL